MPVSKMFSWINALFRSRTYTLRNFTLFLLVLFCIQYIPIESRAGVSWVKVGAMIMTAFVFLRYIVINKASLIGFIYMLWIIITAYILHPTTFRASTVIYLFMFVTTFMAFYTFVWIKHVLDIESFIKFLRNFILVLVAVLLAQQFCLILGIKIMPILNLCQVLNRGIGANSLTFEPSTFGRVINVLFYAYLKCNEYRNGKIIRLTDILKGDHKLVTIAFLWAVLTMGSGTAFIAVAITALYFMRGWYILFAFPMFVGVYFILEYSGNESFQRAVNASQATMSGDIYNVMETDGSAAMRIVPMLNTLNLDLSDWDSWTGRGCDTARTEGYYSQERYMGQISDYGLISYLLELMLIFGCSIRFFSLGTLMFFAGVGGGIGNISYGWGLLMIFTCVRYFHDTYKS